jgi:phospholipid/cholesterol/gamma-HCH transport system substrate-binding protein
MSRRTLINLIFFAGIFVVMCVWAVNNIVTVERIEQPYTITGDFPATAGVRPDAEVAYLGVHFGRVSSIERLPGHIRITMKIDRDREIPEGSIARVFRKSAIGEPYIDFVPPDDERATDGPYIEAGDNVPIEQTQIPLEFDDLLRSASGLISAIDPAQAGTLIHELALALAGRGDSLRQLTVSGDRLAATFAERTDVLDRLATNNTRLTHVVAEHSRSLGESLTNLRLVAESLRSANGDVQVLLDRGSQLLATTADLVEDVKGNLDCTLHDLVDVIDVATTPEHLQGLSYVLDNAPTAFGYVWATRDVEADGVWVRVNLLAEVEHPPTQYAPPHELPTQRAVAPCVSALASSGGAPVDFVPTAVIDQSRQPVTLPTPPTGGGALAGVAGLLLALGAAGRWVVRRWR